MKSIALAVLLLAACAKATEAGAWRGAGKVFVVVDTRNTMANMRQALATQGYGKVSINNAPPEYMIRDAAIMVYLTEDSVPPATSYSPMTPHQAAQLAMTYREGGEGVCVNPMNDACERRLRRTEAAALEAELKKDAKPPLPFVLMRRPA